uniref:Uncharacterized protein n=1 Tax=Leersia perrieri TaxID=77586 RepID=A0A0D9VML1_9ORYZ
MAVVSTAASNLLLLHATAPHRRRIVVAASAARFDRRSAALLLLSSAAAAPPANAAGIGLFGIRKKLERAEEAAAEAVREVEEAAVEAAEVTVEAAEKGAREVAGEGMQLFAGAELAGDGLVQAGVVAGAEALGVVVGLSVPVTSSSTGGDNPDEEPVLPLLQELADCLVLPPKFLSQLPRDLRLDLNDAAFDLSNGTVLDECGQEVGDLLLNLAKAWDVAFGKRLVSAGRRFQSMGQYGNGETKKIAETMAKIGKLLSKRPVVQSEVAAMKAKRKLKYANDNALQMAKSLRVSLLVLGYTSTALSVFASLGLLLLAQQINSDDKPE